MRPLGGNYEEDMSKEELSNILKEIVTGIAVISPNSDGICLEYTNDAFFEILGYTREEYEQLSDEVKLNFFDQADFADILEKVNGNHEPGDIITMETRVNKKGGKKAWVLISTRKPRNKCFSDKTLICSFIDVTDQKKLQMRYEEEKQRYEIVEDISDNILFNYDVEKDVFECSAKILKGIGTRTKIDNAIETFTYGDIFDHRDVPKFVEALSNAFSGKKINLFDARVMNNHRDSIWYRIKFSVIFDEEGNASKFVGTMSDIDKEKKEKSRLISQAECDQLTGFLNKMSTSLKITEIIKEKPNNPGAFMLIDIDDFKKLNDTYGHHEGDNFLRALTSKLTIRFGATNILGRIGGEEFVVYLNSKETGAGIKTEASNAAVDIQKMCNAVRLDSAPEKEFSCSVGIAIYPVDGITYNELYEKADKTMYRVKKSGKKNYAFSE